ncbi:radical SAM protein [bacterium]|nr:radical SAM protein [bacterium]
MRQVIKRTKKSEIATVYIADIDGKKVEFVESIQPPLSKTEKWVMILSTLFGCPSGCLFCDAGGAYHGKMTSDDILFQCDHMVYSANAKGIVETKRLKVQFARMGEPSLNSAVLDVLRELPHRYEYKGALMPSVSSIAPLGTESFFEDLIAIKNTLYGKNFQLQFSIHSTDKTQRDHMMPIDKWDLQQIADYGNKFFSRGERKITLNFAASEKISVDVRHLADIFDNEKFIIKITPVNPTYSAVKHGLDSSDAVFQKRLAEEFTDTGFEVIHSIGENEENKIGSNCGQYILSERGSQKGSYTYELEDV